MYGVAFSIVKKEDVSQDIVHNVIYKLMLLETSKFPSSNELTWLYKVVKNEALMFLRSNSTPLISLEDVKEPISEDRDIHDFVDMDMYYSMIKGLKDEQRQVVTLKVLGGYTHKEISVMLGKPIGTIQWIYNTSIKKLKITLSSVMIAIILSGVGFIARLINYITKTNTAPEEFPGQTTYIPFDYLIVVFAVIFVSLSIVFLLIFKKSHKIPTKADRKNI
jgi:RNA polymerase sigma-70 factor (ECF subfamily)